MGPDSGEAGMADGPRGERRAKSRMHDTTLLRNDRLAACKVNSRHSFKK